jgi:hypothetical protein
MTTAGSFAVDLRHLKVGEHDIEVSCFELDQRRSTAFHPADGVAVELEHLFDQLTELRFIVDD